MDNAGIDGVSVAIEGRTIVLSGLSSGIEASVYTIDGLPVAADMADADTRRFGVATSGCYIVRIGGKDTVSLSVSDAVH